MEYTSFPQNVNGRYIKKMPNGIAFDRNKRLQRCAICAVQREAYRCSRIFIAQWGV